MRRRVGVGVVGVAVVGLYAALMALQALVLDPLAAVPGSTLPEILGHLDRTGFDVAGDVRSVLVAASIGVVLAIAVAVWGIVSALDPIVSVVLFLGILAFGAPVTFGTGFALGMDVADAFGVGGGAHTVWTGVLYGTSVLALVGIPAVLVGAWSRRSGRRRAAATT